MFSTANVSMDAVGALCQYTFRLGAKCFQRRVGLGKFFRQNFEQNKRFLRRAFCWQKKAFSSRI